MSIVGEVKVADEVFIATALLHKEQPDRSDFTISEIVDRAKKEGLTKELRPGVRTNAASHCVANRPPDTGKYRVLYATGTNTRRLLKTGDDIHPRRDGKIWPNPDEVPQKYHDLIAWAQARYESGSGGQPNEWLGQILELRGTGKHLWQDEDADQYVQSLREGWE